ncbi:hypothetical protein FA95DRAFT_1505714 [Auriscalpium vulgare]|uniref:Uncharacterized protein n=1 Tax=Auriscalpium vulgare TaxID=40419 RepID=A0ACB8R4C6_9AGAM|nr:hypothetical protein FA95DRAFT_1505714 [Auriscalpium vulgare]
MINIRSTHNQRIERFWVDVGAQFCRRWRAFFTRLENLHSLDPTDPQHLWLLHKLFLPLINNDCDAFRSEWNSHPISTEHNRTPTGIRLMSTVEHGTYPAPSSDEYADVHPDILNRYYGVDRRYDHGTGLEEAAADIRAEDWGTPTHDLAQRIAQDQQHHIRHEAIDVADNRNPFTADQEVIFWQALQEAGRLHIIPPDMMLTQQEWDLHGDGGGYPADEEIKVGKAGRVYHIPLPTDIWYPRAVYWCQAISLLKQLHINA